MPPTRWNLPQSSGLGRARSRLTHRRRRGKASAGGGGGASAAETASCRARRRVSAAVDRKQAVEGRARARATALKLGARVLSFMQRWAQERSTTATRVVPTPAPEVVQQISPPLDSTPPSSAHFVNALRLGPQPTARKWAHRDLKIRCANSAVLVRHPIAVIVLVVLVRHTVPVRVRRQAVVQRGGVPGVSETVVVVVPVGVVPDAVPVRVRALAGVPGREDRKPGCRNKGCGGCRTKSPVAVCQRSTCRRPVEHQDCTRTVQYKLSTGPKPVQIHDEESTSSSPIQYN